MSNRASCKSPLASFRRTPESSEFKKLFEPGRIGTLTLKNRLVMEPIGTRYADSRGHVTERYISYLEERAKGGVALITNEASRMIKPPPWPPFNLAINDDKCIPGLSELVRIVKKYDTRILIELVHLGIIGSEFDPGLVPAAPSPYRYHVSGVMLREMNKAEIRFVMQKHVEAAIRAKKAGYDGVMINVAHGTLLHMFLSPKRNKRSDEYGGCLENRCRFACESIRGVREALGSNFCIIVRMCGDDFLDGGITLEDAVNQAPAFVEAGADALDISAGVFHTSAHKFTPTLLQEEGIRVYMAEAIKKVVNVPVITCGKLQTPEFMEKVLSEGRADFIGLARPLLADPYLPNKIREGRLEDIRPCIYCNLGCRHFQIRSEGFRVTCNVNPVCGIEGEYKLVKAQTPKKVMVIGGGLAGMESAVFLAKQGYNVSISNNVLYEELKGLAPELHIIGDSREPRNSLFAIHEGFKVGNLIPAPIDSDFEETLRG